MKENGRVKTEKGCARGSWGKIDAFAAFEDDLRSPGTWGPPEAGRGVWTDFLKDQPADPAMFSPGDIASGSF